MSLDTKEAARSMADKIFMRPIGRAMANPLILAVMITAVVMIIVVYTYDRDHIFRTMLRVFGVCTLFLFLNNHVLINDINARQLNPDQQNVIRVLESGGGPYGGTHMIAPGMNSNSSAVPSVLEQLPSAADAIVPG